MDIGAWGATGHGVAKSRYNLVTKQQQQILSPKSTDSARR